MAPRTWFALDATYCADSRVQALGAEFGPGGPLTLIHLMGAAKVQGNEGRVTIAYSALAHAAFLKKTVVARQIVARATEAGLFEFISFDESGFVGRFPQWNEWQIADPSGATRARRYRDKKRPRHGDDRDGVTPYTYTDTKTEEPNGSSSGEIKLLPFAAESVSLCETLADLVAKNGSKRPRVTEAWVSSARLLLHRDERPYDEALSLIRWCQADEFWRSNILSMPKFRQQYDRLRLRAQQQPSRHLRPVDTVEQDIERYRRLAEEAKRDEEGGDAA